MFWCVFMFFFVYIEVQGSSWGNTWLSCSWESINNENVWGCSNTIGKTPSLGNDLPLNLKVTDRDGAVSNSYGLISNFGSDGLVYYLNGFSSSYIEDDDTFLGDGEYSVGEIIVVVLFVLIGIGIIGVIGYCGWRKYKNKKFDRKDEQKMMDVEEEVVDDEVVDDEIVIDTELEKEIETASNVNSA